MEVDPMKKFSLFLSLALVCALLAGCAGTPVVYYTNCTCPVETQEEAPAVTQAPATAAPEAPVTAEGALKTGLAIATDISKSASASDANGKADFAVTIVAVLVDDNGVIQDCIIDGISETAEFDASGAIVKALPETVQTKNEKGPAYGMVEYGKAKFEWDEQAAAVAAFVIGKTAEELRTGYINESGYAIEGTDLATSATINLYGIVSAIEAAAANAQHLGAEAGDSLKLAVLAKDGGSADATKDSSGNVQLNGLVQLDADVTALTVKDGVITSCIIDSVQAKVPFDASGALTGDVKAPVQTKNQLGSAYNMVAYGNAQFEWNEQAASFAAYVTGKTLEEVSGIAVSETTKPAEGTDLAASVTIAIGGFQALIAKALA